MTDDFDVMPFDDLAADSLNKFDRDWPTRGFLQDLKAMDVRIGSPFLAPFRHRQYGDAQILAFLCRYVCVSPGALHWGAIENAGVAQLRQSPGQEISRDPEAFLQIVETTGTEQQRIAHDKKRPSIAQLGKSLGDRAMVLPIVDDAHARDLSGSVDFLNHFI